MNQVYNTISQKHKKLDIIVLDVLTGVLFHRKTNANNLKFIIFLL